MTDADITRAVALLNTDERERFARIGAPADRRDYAAAHALLRQMLTDTEPNIAPDAWRFERTAHGKPYLSPLLAGASPIRFSLSHTSGLVACAVSRDAEVGIDVEGNARIVDVDLMMRAVCSSGEQMQLSDVVPSARTEYFLDLWTLKEAYMKARGIGIPAALDQVSFTLSPSATISASLPENSVGSWWLALIRLSSAGRLSIAMAADPGSIPILDAAVIGLEGSLESLTPTQTSAPFHSLSSTTLKCLRKSP